MTWRLITDIDGHWPAVAPILDRCFTDDFDDFTLDDVKEWLDTRRMRLLVYDECDKGADIACVFETVVYPRRMVMRIVLIAGHGCREAKADWEREVEAFARQLGCDSLEAWCLEPQARLFRSLGMTKSYNVMRKEIGHDA